MPIFEGSESEIQANVLRHRLSPSQTLKHILHVCSNTLPDGRPKKQGSVMIWGSPGIGKTEIVREYAKTLGARLVSLHLPQFDPTDLKGIVVRLENDSIRWVPSSYLPGFVVFRGPTQIEHLSFNFPYATTIDFRVYLDGQDVTNLFEATDQDVRRSLDLKCTVQCDPTKLEIHVFERAVLFLDELSAAVPDVQNAALQLVLDRRVGEYDLAPNCPIVAAGNTESDGAFTHVMSSALANRFDHVRMVPSVDDFLRIGIQRGFHDSVISYVNRYGMDRLMNYSPDRMVEGDLGWPSPRSWEKLSDQLHGAEYLEKDIIRSIIVGHIGTTIGNEFIIHWENEARIPDPNTILTGQPYTCDEMDIGTMYQATTKLAVRFGDFYRKYYNPESGKTQCPEWITACDGLFGFLNQYVRQDVQQNVLTILRNFHGINTTCVQMSEQFSLFATKNIDLLKRMMSQ